ncbi:hypothetical protein FIV00_00350 [Labrenzia sp. THAF82]|uniref:glycosyltransferase family 2 protein n=1 Tax=Labrenzia sp. THAF82 TaxID=2587861 RepID=UPI00126869C3|nr:glycosyltransferase family 2 protein [Labrenzia sp. THAF82]QFT28925.1 hypothetical protein FIV00_00350 [Labrenzia sp. THAF82]
MIDQSTGTLIQHRIMEAFGALDADALIIPADGVVAVILAFNEALRFPFFLKHYRELGIRHFVVVDNMSNDGTSDFLAAQSDVSVIRTEKPYSEYKSVWRQLLCERYLLGRWTLFPDVDELLVYPGWPGRKIDDLVSSLDNRQFQALFCPMVDMYPKGPLKQFSYKAGDSFLDGCSYFDPKGYRYNPLKGSHGKRYKTPARHIFGGTRERLFHQNAKRRKTWLDKGLLSLIFSIRTRAPESDLGRRCDQFLFKLVKSAVPDTAAVQSKVPLLKWDHGYMFSGGVHGIDKKISIAPEWGVLLHFKYLDDFQSKVTEALERKQHTDNAGHYRDYKTQLNRLMNEGLFISGSKKFTGVDSLIECGLMRDIGG